MRRIGRESIENELSGFGIARKRTHARARAPRFRHCRLEACRGRIAKLAGSLSSCQVHYAASVRYAAERRRLPSLEENVIPLPGEARRA